MKKQLRGKICMIVGAIIMGTFVLGLFADPEGEYSAIFWTALTATAIGFVLCVIGFIVAFALRYAYPKNRRRYIKYPVVWPIDYQKELATVRANFAADTRRKKNRIVIEEFYGSKPFYDFSVIESGKIYYAHIVQANSRLFEDKAFAMLTHPAVVIYSTDQYFEQNPLALSKLARFLFESRNTDNWAGKILNNEYEYESNLQVPMEWTDGRVVYMTTVMIYRKHLPLGYLSDSLLPIIANPQSATAVFVVDVKYWTQPLIGNFVHGYNYE